MSESPPDADAFVTAAGGDADLEALAARVDAQADDLIALLDLHTVVRGLSDELVEGFGDAADRSTEEYYRLGTQLGQATDVAERASDPRVVETLDAGASAFTDETADRRVGLFGLFSALRNDDVQQTLGTLVKAAERVGRTRNSGQE
jgi:uncharacterized protein YjgD (DUF1641 family)